MRKLLVTITAIFYIVNTISAQTDSRLKAEMKRLQNTYKEAGGLQFDVRYVYSTESQPLVLLDSIKGKMVMNGSDYRMALNNTETIKNVRYLIHVFKDDKLIYLTKPSSPELSANPGALIDSAFTNVANITYSIDSTVSVKRMTLNFPEPSAYKKVVFTINNATGYITKVRYVVKTEQLLGAKDQGDVTKGYDEYSIVEATFSNYRKGQCDPKLFDENFFFVKNGEEYTPVASYKDFSIFLGTPNL